MTECRDLGIFCADRQTDGQNDYFTPCGCMQWGKKVYNHDFYSCYHGYNCKIIFVNILYQGYVYMEEAESVLLLTKALFEHWSEATQ